MVGAFHQKMCCYDELLWRWIRHSLEMGGAKSQKGSNRGSGAGLPSDMYSLTIKLEEKADVQDDLFDQRDH